MKKGENWNDLEFKVDNLFSSNLGLDTRSIEIERVQRLGQQEGGGRPRRVMVSLLRLKDKQQILSLAENRRGPKSSSSPPGPCYRDGSNCGPGWRCKGTRRQRERGDKGNEETKPRSGMKRTSTKAHVILQPPQWVLLRISSSVSFFLEYFFLWTEVLMTKQIMFRFHKEGPDFSPFEQI